MTVGSAAGTYRSANAVLVRIPLAPLEAAGRATDGCVDMAPSPEQLRNRVSDLLTDRLLRDAVALASPSTARTGAVPLDRLPAKRVRTLAASLTTYAARMRA